MDTIAHQANSKQKGTDMNFELIFPIIVESFFDPSVKSDGTLVDSSDNKEITVSHVESVLNDFEALNALVGITVKWKEVVEKVTDEDIESMIRDYRDSIWVRWLLDTRDGVIRRKSNSDMIRWFGRCKYDPDMPDTDNSDYVVANTYSEIIEAACELCKNWHSIKQFVV